MAKDKITEYDATANNNTVCGDVNIAENSALPSDMNNFAREIMSHLKEGLGSGTPLYVDQTNNRLGIGTSSPATPLHVQASSQDANVRFQASDDGYATRLQLYANNVSGASYNAIQSYVNGDSTVQWEISGAKASAEDQMLFSTGGSERMRIDGSGNVGIGTSSANFSRGKGIHLADSYYIGFGAGNGTRPDFQIGYNESDNTLNFACGFGSDTTDIRADTSGNFMVGASYYGQPNENGVGLGGSEGAVRCHHINGTSNGTSYAIFTYNGLGIGSITQNTTSSVAYNTTSDHRLKENVTADWDATTRLKQLNPVRFNFIADADTTVDGFLAHEVQSVVPEAITGTHNEVDADGNPVYQGIDQSKLVPLLVKTIQELEARITALETA